MTSSAVRVDQSIRSFACAATALLLSAVAGCPPQQTPPSFHTKEQAIRIIDRNRQSLTTGLKARGIARGRFRDDKGNNHAFELIGKLLVAPPNHLRFTMESILGSDEFEVGMNRDKWWTVTHRPGSAYHEGPRGQTRVAESPIPITPEQLIESIGLNPFQPTTAAQRIVEDHQQLIFFSSDEFGNVIIEKEYWLDRRPRHLIRRILYRDDQGRVVFKSQLDRYRPIRRDGPLLPRLIKLSWPMGGAELTLTVDRWEERENINSSFRGFVSPYDRGVEFDVVDSPGRSARDHR